MRIIKEAGSFLSSSLKKLIPLNAHHFPGRESLTFNAFIQGEISSGQKWLELIEQDKSVRDVFSAALKDKVIVDLGASENWGAMHRIAIMMGAREYVAVDPFWPSVKNSLFKKKIEVLRVIPNPVCPAKLVRTDALTYLKQLPDNSCNIALNGIDRMIISSASYQCSLARETERVVPSGGLAFGILSYPLSLIAINANLDKPEQLASSPLEDLSLNHAEAEINPKWDDYSPFSSDRLLIKR